MCEAGKIPLNQWFDTTKHTFTNEGKEAGDMKVYLQTMLTRITQYAGNKKLFEPLEKYLKQKDTYLYDVSQLLTIKEFQQAFWPNEFYEPPTQESGRQKRPVYLMDVFSLWSDVSTISAWFLTDSVLAALGLNRTQVTDVQKRLKIMQDAAQSGTLPTTLEELWPVVFRGMYGKDINALPVGSDTVLNVGFDSKVFSVLSYGTVGKVTFKLYGILQQVEKGDQKEYKLVRLYAL